MLALLPIVLASQVTHGLAHRSRDPRPLTRYEPAIRVMVNCHADPFTGPNHALLYAQWIDNANWLLDELDSHGAKVSWGEVGEFGEFVVEGGASGPGAALLRRAYASGRGFQSHSHSEYRAAAHMWPAVPAPGDDAWELRNWNDALGWTEQALLVALSPLSEPLESILCLRGSHVPSNEPEFHEMMAEFGIPFRPAGPGEEFYRYFEHYVYHPYRPSPSNTLDESFGAPFVQLVHGSGIGLAQIHYGIFQDNTLESMKAQFLLELVNWRYRWKIGADDRVWCFGGGGHPSDYDAGDPARTTLPPLLDWLDQWFVGKTMPDGSVIATYASEREVGEEFLAWETAHPSVSSFRYPVLVQDYAWYPWLRAAHEELCGSRHVADLAAPAGCRAFRLTNATKATAVVAWNDGAATSLDLSAVFGASTTVILRNLETGASSTAPASAVPIGNDAIAVRL